MAGTNSAFNTQGASPTLANAGLGQNYNPLNFGNYSTPQSKALSSFGSGVGIGQSKIPAVGQSLVPPTNQDIKTHTLADGTSQTYYPSTPKTSAPQSTMSPLTPEQLATIKANLAKTDAQNQTGTNPGLISTPPVQGSSTPTPTPAPTPATPTYSGLISSLVDKSSKPSAQYTDLTQKAEAAANDAARTNMIIGQGEQDALHNPEYSLDTGIGRSGQIAANYGLIGQDATARATALGNLANTANTQQGLQQTGLISAVGAAAPIQAPYSNQVLDPITGQPISGGGSSTGTSALSGLPAEAQSAIKSYAQQVQNGSMTRADAESRLSAYGIKGTNALNEVLGTGFNTNASNASAGTTATGQQIKTAADSTNRALDTLSTAFSALPGFATGGIPATNSIADWILSSFGSAALSQYKTNLADARSQLIGVLNSSGGTPTGNEATALQYLPENMTKAQFDANVGTTQNPGVVRQLVAQKVGSFTSSGNQNQSNGGASFNSDGTLRAVSF